MFDEIRSLLRNGEVYGANVPPVDPNTARAVAVSELASAGADPLRPLLSHALWEQGLDTGKPHILASLGCSIPTSLADAERWNDGWLGLDRYVAPKLVFADGAVSRGLDTLE